MCFSQNIENISAVRPTTGWGGLDLNGGLLFLYRNKGKIHCRKHTETVKNIQFTDILPSTTLGYSGIIDLTTQIILKIQSLIHSVHVGRQSEWGSSPVNLTTTIAPFAIVLMGIGPGLRHRARVSRDWYYQPMRGPGAPSIHSKGITSWFHIFLWNRKIFSKAKMPFKEVIDFLCFHEIFMALEQGHLDKTVVFFRNYKTIS